MGYNTERSDGSPRVIVPLAWFVMYVPITTAHTLALYFLTALPALAAYDHNYLVYPSRLIFYLEAVPYIFLILYFCETFP